MTEVGINDGTECGREEVSAGEDTDMPAAAPMRAEEDT